MPKLVSELTPGVAERSVDGGRSADSYTRNWRLILNDPNESYDIQQAINVRIGDAHPNATSVPVPCISISERADGESRLVRIITAQYRTTPGDSPSQDPNSQPPDVRPAKFSISSSLIEVPATEWKKLGDVWVPNDPNNPWGNGAVQVGLGGVEDALMPGIFDRIDGVTKLVPLINITIEQYDNSPVSRLDDSGKVNNDNFSLLGLQVTKFSCMLRSISVRPVVETFGNYTYRGFLRTFELSIKTHGGWLIDQILEGFNIINDDLNGADVDNDALSLEHDKDGFVKDGPELAAGTQGKKVRASVLISARNGGRMQRPSALPVAINENGTPRNVRTAVPPVLRHRYCTQGDMAFGDNFVNLGIRIAEVI